MSVKNIAIVGGGPAGAFAAAELARAGRDVLLFDEKLAWEKPCGGGLTPKAIEHWPFLRDAIVERNWIHDCELIASSGRRVRFSLRNQIAIFSRLTLNGLMLHRAQDAGAQVMQQRIVSIEGGPGKWHLKAADGQYEADFVVLAAGARNPLRGQFSPPLGPENFVLALGYYIPGTARTVQIKFVRGLNGYIWVFPRADHFSVGICGRMPGKNSGDLRALLAQHIPEFGLSLEGAQFYAHLIPSLTKHALRRSSIAGDGWAMIGDAAGFVDAITGEGLYYALRSAELFSHTMSKGEPQTYATLAAQEIVPELEMAAGIAERFYSGEWLGAPVIERMIGLTARSSHFRDLMRDLFSGTQEYASLKRRVHRSLPVVAAEALVSTLRRRRGNLEEAVA
jgi:flavin-dependent dehydrogenase